MTAEVAKYTLEQVEALELAPGTEHQQLEGWVPELAANEDLRQALEKAFDYRGDVTLTLKSGESIDAYIFNRTPAPRSPILLCSTSRPPHRTSARSATPRLRALSSAAKIAPPASTGKTG